MEPKIIKGCISRYIAKKFANGENPEVFGFYSIGTPKGPSVHATLAVSQDGEEPRLWTEEQLRAFVQDLRDQTMSMAVEASINRIAAKHGITPEPDPKR